MTQLKPLEHSRNLLICQSVDDVADDFDTDSGQPSNASRQISDCRYFDHLETLSGILTLDAVLLPVDPTSVDDFDGLRRLVSILTGAAPAIATYASFNPRWIGNLMTQVVADVHFAGRPGLRGVLAEIEQHIAAAVGNALKAAGDTR